MILVAIVLVFDVALVVVFGRRRSTLVAVAVVVAVLVEILRVVLLQAMVPVEILRADHDNG